MAPRGEGRYDGADDCGRGAAVPGDGPGDDGSGGGEGNRVLEGVHVDVVHYDDCACLGQS